MFTATGASDCSSEIRIDSLHIRHNRYNERQFDRHINLGIEYHRHGVELLQDNKESL